MQAFTYWVIHYVPDVVRRESQNIGVICGSDKGDWSVAFDWRYLQRTPADVREWANWFSQQVAQRDQLVQDHEFTRAWVEGIRQRQANSIQVSEPMPVTADSSRDAATLLFRHLVEREHKSRERRVTRRGLRSDVRHVYNSVTSLVEGRDYFDRPEIRLGQLRADFDFVELVEARPTVRNVWAFDMAGLDDLERNIQAWNYEITRLRDDGAMLLLDRGQQRRLPQDSVVTAIIDPPRHESQRRIDVYSAALESWEREQVDVLTVGQFEERAELQFA